MPPLRISAISYLNTAPLLWDFQHGQAPAGFELGYTTPAECAESLRAGAADIGIIPAFAYHQIRDLLVIPDVAIAARGPVRSILLISRKPIETVETIATDISSRSSVALLDVWLRRRHGGPRRLQPCAPRLDAMLERADAALLIGDAALTAPQAGFHVYDLAAEWTRWTGKPFVFAFWAVRQAAARPGLADVFQRSRDRGLEPQNLDAVAREWAPRIALPEPEIRDYLSHNVHYGLDPDCREGMELFLDYAVQEGILREKRELSFLES